MKRKNVVSQAPTNLRLKAEEQLKTRKAKTNFVASESDMLKLIHELEVHQIELELQNEELVLANVKARAATEKYEELYDFAPTGYFTVSQEGKILEMNLRGAQMLGKERSLLINRHFIIFIRKEAQSVFANFLEEIFKGKNNAICDVSISCKDDNCLHVNLTGIISENKEQCYITATDITERKLLEEGFKRNQEKFRVLAEVSLTGIWTTDPLGNNTYVSPQWCQITGISPEAAKGNGWANGLHPDDRELIMNDWKRLKPSDTPKTYDFRFIRPDGSIVWVLSQATVVRDIDGNVIEWIGTIIDITERKHLENALRENEERLRFALKATNDVVWDWDIVNDSQRWNEAGTKVFGWTEIVGNPVTAAWWLERIHPDDQLRVDKGFFKTINENSASTWQDEYRFKKADGSFTEVLDRGYILRNDQGKAIRMIGAMLDISERKKAEQDLRESEHFANSIANTTPALLYLYDFEQAKNIWTNDVHKRFFEEFEKDSSNFDFSDISQFTHPDDFRELIKRADEMQNNKSINHYEVEHRLKLNGTWKWMKLLVTVFKRNVYGQPIQILGAVIDIDDLKKTEYDLLEAKEKAERNERELLKAQEIAHIGSWYLNVATNEVLWTEELYNMYGFDPTMPPPPFTEHMKLFTPESWEILSTSLAKTRETGIPYELELKTIRKDNSYGWMWVRGEAVKDKNDTIIGLWGAAQDITERKQSEQELIEAKEKAEESEARFRILMEGIDAIAVQGYDPDGITQFWNKASEKLYGYTQQEAIGSNLLDLIIPSEMKNIVTAEIHEMALTGEPIPSGELVLKHKNGSPVPVISHHAIVKVPGRPQELFCLDIDIAKRKKAEEALRMNEDLLNASQRLSKTGGWAWDVEKKTMHWSEEAYRIHDFTPGEIKPGSAEHIAKSSECYRTEDRALILEAFQRCMEEGIPYDLEFPFTSCKGRQLWIRTAAQPIIENGKTTMIIGNIIDITERKLAEIEINKSKELLSQLNKRLETVRESERADISREIHDQLGQSLTALKIDLMSLRSKMKPESKEKELLGDLIKMVNSISRDVQRISSELRPLMLDDLGLAATLEWHCEEFATRTGLKVVLDIETSQSNCINRDLVLYRVAQESLTNIIRHANAGIVKVSLREINNNIVLTIHDNGIGIPAEKLDSHKSLGLLGMSERVKQYDGKLEIQSSGDIGTIIKASIPLKQL